MDNMSKGSTPIYEDFVPTSEVVSLEDSDTLHLHLPGFKKEQMRVQLTRGILRISGSMPIGDNKVKRFQKEFPIAQNCDTNKITARFDNGILHVKQPKFITPPAPTPTPIPSQQHHKLPPPPPPTTPSPAPQEPKKPANVGENLTRNEEKSEAKKGNVATGKEDGAMLTKTENYGKMVGAMGKRLKMQRTVIYVVLAALFTCIVAIYVKSLIISFRQPKNSY